MKANKKRQEIEKLKKTIRYLKRESSKWRTFFYCAATGDEPSKYKKEFDKEMSFM